MQRGLNQTTKIPHSRGNDQDCRENRQLDTFLQTIQITKD